MVAAGEIRDARETDFFGKAFDRRLRYCARKLEGRSFLCGNKPTIADFQMFHYMGTINLSWNERFGREKCLNCFLLLFVIYYCH